MTDGWAEVVLSAGTVLLAGRGPWERHQRRTRHGRLAARRLHEQAQAELARLADHTRARPKAIDHSGEARPPEPDRSILGPDLIGDFYRVVVTELQVWAEEAAQELDQLRGRRLAARRAALRSLRTEIRALCAEIEEREAVWQGAHAVTWSAARPGEPSAVPGGRATESVEVPGATR